MIVYTPLLVVAVQVVVDSVVVLMVIRVVISVADVVMATVVYVSNEITSPTLCPMPVASKTIK